MTGGSCKTSKEARHLLVAANVTSCCFETATAAEGPGISGSPRRIFRAQQSKWPQEHFPPNTFDAAAAAESSFVHVCALSSFCPSTGL